MSLQVITKEKQVHRIFMEQSMIYHREILQMCFRCSGEGMLISAWGYRQGFMKEVAFKLGQGEWVGFPQTEVK